MNLTAVTGAGSVIGTLQGYKTGYALGGAPVPGGGCPGTAGTPCVVIGNVADGSAASGAPVRVAGKDGSGNVQDMLTGTDGAVVPSHGTPATADGIAGTRTQTDDAGNPLYNRSIRWVYNGSTFDRDFACTGTAAITFTATSGSLQIVALSGSTVIRVCSIMLASDTVTNITLQYGTGSNCGTGTTAISGPIPNVLQLTNNWMPQAAPRTAASNAFCINSSATATIGGTVTYAQF